jgi:hypothetical protein
MGQDTVQTTGLLGMFTSATGKSCCSFEVGCTCMCFPGCFLFQTPFDWAILIEAMLLDMLMYIIVGSHSGSSYLSVGLLVHGRLGG